MDRTVCRLAPDAGPHQKITSLKKFSSSGVFLPDFFQVSLRSAKDPAQTKHLKQQIKKIPGIFLFQLN